LALIRSLLDDEEASGENTPRVIEIFLSAIHYKRSGFIIIDSLDELDS